MDRVRVGVWGAGVWGEKHARVYHALPDAELVGKHELWSAVLKNVRVRRSIDEGHGPSRSLSKLCARRLDYCSRLSPT